MIRRQMDQEPIARRLFGTGILNILAALLWAGITGWFQESGLTVLTWIPLISAPVFFIAAAWSRRSPFNAAISGLLFLCAAAVLAVSFEQTAWLSFLPGFCLVVLTVGVAAQTVGTPQIHRALKAWGFAALVILLIAVPSLWHARRVSQRNACINNLRQLTAPMICCVPMANNMADGDKLDPNVVCQYIKGGTVPVCPAGGSYQITWIVGGATPKCSVHGDVFWNLYHVRTLTELDDLNHNSEDAQTNLIDSSTRETAGVGAPQQ